MSRFRNDMKLSHPGISCRSMNPLWNLKRNDIVAFGGNDQDIPPESCQDIECVGFTPAFRNTNCGRELGTKGKVIRSAGIDGRHK